MNIFIVTEGGENIGFGHITRCTSIYQALEEVGVCPELIINGDEAIRDCVKGKDCRIFDWLSDQRDFFTIVKDADIVFVDSYLADYNLYENISKTARTVVYFDDEMRMNYPEGFVVNGAILAERMPYPKREGVTYLLGAKYTPLRREFWDVPAKAIRDIPEIIMITFGGTDISNLTPGVLKLLVNAYPQLNKKVVIGKGFRNISEIEAAKDHNTELIYYPDAAEMKNIMLESDMAISAGGQTLYELARVGVPTIAVAVAENQSVNISGLQETGFAEYAGDGTDGKLPEKIDQKIEFLRDGNARHHKSQLGRKVIDGAGSSRIVKNVLFDFHKGQLILKKATLADAEDLFNLANEDAVRQNSFSREKIKRAEHNRWLSEKIGDNNCLLLIINCSGKFAGQVRFDIIALQNEAVINISLCKNIRGLGLSPIIIEESIKELLKMRKHVELINAYVKDGNIASEKSFERAGFRFLEDTVFKGCKTRIYKRSSDNG